MRFRISVGDKDLAYSRLIDDSRPESLSYYHSRSYHCPKCGLVWALWDAECDEPIEWYPCRRTCPAHAVGTWTGDIAGSLILYHTDIVVASRALLEYEVLRGHDA